MFIDTLRSIVSEIEPLQQKLQDPAVHGDPREIARIGKRLSELEELKTLLDEYDGCQRAVAFVEEVRGDPEMEAMANEEAEAARTRLPVLEKELQSFLVPRDPADDRNVILEVRAGTGGEEAAHFAAELLRMYIRYAEIKGWKTEVLDITEAEAGGLKEATCRIIGVGAYGDLKYESGVHRVQRVPETESKGRIHTSAATVAILPEAEEIDIKIRTEDLQIDTFRSGGAGGQNVNKVESAIRITHIPTGTVVACQTERSQLQNRMNAMSLLRSRIYEAERERLAKERGEMRSGQIGTGDRSEKIRTYNFPQDRVTDHRIGENFSNLPVTMEGDIADIIEALKRHDIEQRLAQIQQK